MWQPCDARLKRSWRVSGSGEDEELVSKTARFRVCSPKAGPHPERSGCSAPRSPFEGATGGDVSYSPANEGRPAEVVRRLHRQAPWFI